MGAKDLVNPITINKRKNTIKIY